MRDVGVKVDTVVNFVVRKLSDRRSISTLKKGYAASNWRRYNHNNIENKYEELRDIARSILEDLGVRSSYSKRRK